jgi:hypothetical protein
MMLLLIMLLLLLLFVVVDVDVDVDVDCCSFVGGISFCCAVYCWERTTTHHTKLGGHKLLYGYNFNVDMRLLDDVQHFTTATCSQVLVHVCITSQPSHYMF